MKNRKFIFALTIILLLGLTLPALSFQTQKDQEKAKEIAVDSWLLMGPFTASLPAYQKGLNQGAVIERLLKFKQIDISSLKPKEGASLKWHDGKEVSWKVKKTGKNGISLPGDNKNPSTAYLGTYIDVKRWTKAKLALTSNQVFQAFVDGKHLVSKTQVNKDGKSEPPANDNTATADLKLETGKHLLLIKTVFDPTSNSDWTVKAVLSLTEKYAAAHPQLTLKTDQHMTITHLLDGPKISGVSISPDGEIAAVSISKTLPPSDASESWVEMYSTADGNRIRTFRGGDSITRVTWAPTGHKFSYTNRNKNGATLWVVNLKTGTSIPVLKNIKNLGSHAWAPDSSYIIYSIAEEGKADKPGVKRLQNMADRQPGWRNRSHLYKLDLSDKVSQRLTAGEYSTILNDISPDGNKLLFTRSFIDYKERPFSQTEICALDLRTLETVTLWLGKYFNGAQWSPDGKKLLVLGGPSAFGAMGKNVPNGLIPNEYDTQAYIFDLEAKRADSITKNFDPTVDQAVWCESSNCLFFVTTDKSFRRLYRYSLEDKTYSQIDLGVEVIHQFDIAEEKPIAVYAGSSASVPPKAYVVDLESKICDLLLDPGKADYADIKFGEVERWTFKNKEGTEIEGRIYYPPDFDPKQKYPCIVYYYGGTSPVTRDFGGRYPKNLYAAQGYVVYVLQPSGATGFGQKFSAAHVNDWGMVVADEIIDGVKKFLAAHPFVDSERVGCMGASYGGFMTMLLQTRTNMFKSAVAHAGISSISSYWGEGYWGYAYSAYATANSYPWNRKDIYINQSALFNADKITTPLLLLHGSADTNVPPGESTQLFTALKILGREVEYIQILDQDHHILTYNKRILWTKTIMAWFDRWLKGEHEWWNDLYPN